MTPDQSPIELFRNAWIAHAEGAPTSLGGWQPPAPVSLQGVPRGRRWVVIRAEASDLPALAEFSQLESLTLVGSMDKRVLDVVRRLTSLQYLSVNQPQESTWRSWLNYPGSDTYCATVQRSGDSPYLPALHSWRRFTLPS